LEPLAVPELQVARRHVVDDRVAEDMSSGSRARNVAAVLANDQSELDFVIHLFGRRSVPGNYIERTVHRRWRLGKKHRDLRKLRLASGLRRFLNMARVVEAKADNVLGWARNRSMPADRVGPMRRLRPLDEIRETA